MESIIEMIRITAQARAGIHPDQGENAQAAVIAPDAAIIPELEGNAMDQSDNRANTGAAPHSFEEALARLEEIARALDRGETPLAESLELCAEAAQLTRYCRTQLSEAEGKLEQLVELANGEVRVEPLVAE